MKYLERKWTEGEVEFLIMNSNRLSARQIAKALKRSKGSIIGKRNRLGLNRSQWEPKIETVRHVYLEEYLTGNGYHQVKYREEHEQWRYGNARRL